jgi:hypothetical protein
MRILQKYTKLTCFGQIETFLAQVRHQSEDGDEPSKDRAHNVEIAKLEGRHFDSRVSKVLPNVK